MTPGTRIRVKQDAGWLTKGAQGVIVDWPENLLGGYQLAIRLDGENEPIRVMCHEIDCITTDADTQVIT